MINWFKNKKDRVDFVNEATTPSFSKPIETPPMPEAEASKPEEWIWVEGYKGTNNKMQGYDEFQFELDKLYETEGNIEICKNGFHFCLNLEDVNGYFPWTKSSRYFKVKALVRKKDYDSYGGFKESRANGLFLYSTRINKLVAKHIILTEEITFTDEVLQFVKAKNENKHITTMDIWRKVQDEGYDEYAKSYWREIMCNYYSDSVVRLLLNRIQGNFLINCPDLIIEKANEAKIYIEEGFSRDIVVLLLQKDL